MHYGKTAFLGNTHIGLFSLATENFVFYPPTSSEKFVKQLEILGGERVRAGICDSELLGLYICANSNGAVLPKDSGEEEKKVFEKLGLCVHVLRDRRNAVGNNMCANDYGMIINSRLPEVEVRKIEECLKVKATRCTLAGYEAVGSVCVATNKGFLACPDISEKEFGIVEGALCVKGGSGTVNMGVGFPRLGIIANSRGCVLGEKTSGYEMGGVQQSLEG